MRTELAQVDTDAVEWMWAENGSTATKVLNTDPLTGERTVLLRSAPRPEAAATRRRAHYHAGTEEFLTLGPDFTFDNDIWLPRFSYVYLPAGCVHGTDVRVPNGYVMYLRTTGDVKPVFLDVESRPPGPPLHGPQGQSAIVSVADSGAISELPSNAPSRLISLARVGKQAQTYDIGCGCELFVADGKFITADGRTFCRNAYACLPSETQLNIAEVIESAVILISPISAKT
jgi:hypothetical protein